MRCCSSIPSLPWGGLPTACRGAIALLAGGLVISWSAEHASIALPLVGDLHSWRLVFFLTGIPDPFLALLVLLFREPARIAPRQSEDGAAPVTLAAFLRRNWQLLALLCLAFGAMSMIVNSTFDWTPTILGRTFGASPIVIGLIMSLLVVVAGLPGQMATGWWVDRRHARGDLTANLCVFPLTLPIAASCGILALLSRDLAVFGIAMVPHYFFAMTFLGVAAAALQMIAPSRLRGRVSGLFIMIITLIGFGMGPTLVAATSPALDSGGMVIGSALPSPRWR